MTERCSLWSALSAAACCFYRGSFMQVQFSKEKYLLESPPEKLRKELEEELKLSAADIRSHGWYHGHLPREVSETLVLRNGDFLVRDSLTSVGAPASPESMKFYKRTRPPKDPRELSSPKITGETFSKAKEQHHTPKRTASQAQEATPSRNRTSQTQAKTTSASPGKSPQVAPTLQHTGRQQAPPRLKDSPSRESLDHEKKNGKALGTLEIRQHTQARELEGRVARTGPGQEQESFKRRAAGRSRPQRTSLHTVRESEKGAGKDSRQRDTNGKSTEDRTASKETLSKRDSLLSFKDMWSRKGSVVSPREAKGRRGTLSRSKEVSSKEDIVASVHSIPGTQQSPKGPLSPGPWKVPSSAKILTEAEVLRDPL